MSEQNIFETASRMRLAFDSSRGLLSVDDLWELPLSSNTGKTNLDSIALELYKQLKTGSDIVSFVDMTAKSDPVVQLRFDIIKRVIEVRKAENEAAARRREKAHDRQVILAALARRKESSIDSMSEEDLQKALKSLDEE